MTVADETTTELVRQEFHPASEMFPLMETVEFERFVEDIKTNGLLEPIWRFKGKIIDGRNRWKACNVAGVKHRFSEWEGEEKDITKFVISMNLHRRHLNESQRAMVAAKIANSTIGGVRRGDDFKTQVCVLKNNEAAELLNTSERSVSKARTVRKTGADELIKAVEGGEISITAAAEICRLPKDVQAEKIKSDRAKKYAEKRDRERQPKTRSLKKTNAEKQIRSVVGTLIGMTSSLDQFNAKDANFTAEEAKQFDDELVKVVAAIRHFRRQLTEVANGN